MGDTGRRVGVGAEVQGVSVSAAFTLVFAERPPIPVVLVCPKCSGASLNDAKEPAADLAWALLGDGGLDPLPLGVSVT